MPCSASPRAGAPAGAPPSAPTAGRLRANCDDMAAGAWLLPVGGATGRGVATAGVAGLGKGRGHGRWAGLAAVGGACGQRGSRKGGNWGGCARGRCALRGGALGLEVRGALQEGTGCCIARGAEGAWQQGGVAGGSGCLRFAVRDMGASRGGGTAGWHAWKCSLCCSFLLK